MLSYDEALSRILDSIQSATPTETIPLSQTRGRILAADIHAEIDLPPFANSAVDGFAVRLADTVGASLRNAIILPVTETIAAGTSPTASLEIGQSARILTGAMIPIGCDAIVMLEDTKTVSHYDIESVLLFDPGAASHIRKAGSDLRAGTLALTAGTTIDAGATGLLAALNQAVVPCRARPRVGLIATGDELVPVGPDPLPPGGIRNSNAPALAAAIEAAGGIVVAELRAGDSPKSTRESLDACVRAGCDLIVTSGGVSVGAFDYVKAVVEEMGELDFWRIAIKPGKPLAFGRVGDALFFGLPGNPVSSLVTFELFVRPVLRKLSGDPQPLRRKVSATLTEALPHVPGRREFVRATLEWADDNFHATPTGSQASHRLASLLGADAYLVAHEDHGDYDAGDRLPALLLH